MAGVDGLDELGDALPFTEVLATGDAGLAVVDVFTDLATDVAGAIASSDPTTDDIEAAISGSRTVGGVTVDVDVDVSATGVTFTTLSITRDDIMVPLGYLSGSPEDPATFSLEGGQLDLDLALSFAGLTLVKDGPEFVIPSSAPAATLNAVISLPDPDIATRLGILDVTASGSVTADVTFEIAWVDPDASGQITQFELENSASLDLFDVSIQSPSNVAMDITLSSTLAGLGGITGSIAVSHDLAGGELPSPTVDFGPNGELGDFTNMTPQDVLAAIAQLATSLRSLQLVTGNPDLPLIDQNLAEFGDWTDQLTKFFVDNHLAGAENPLDLLIEPEQGADCGDGIDNDGDTFVDEGCPGQPGDLEAKGLAAIDDVIAKLEAGLGVTGGALGLTYDAPSHSILFSIDKDSTFFQDPLTAEFNLADELAKAGVTSVQLDGSTNISVTPSYGIHIGVGIDLSDALADPNVTPLTSRVFIRPAASGPELFFDAPITGNIGGSARIAMLELTLADDNLAGDVNILTKRATDTDPMISLDIVPAGADDRITLTEIFAGMSEAGLTDGTPANEFEIDVPGAFTATAKANLAVPEVRLDATGSIAGTDLGSGWVSFAWDDVFAGDPVVDADAGFTDNFLAFNIDPDDPQALFTAILAAVDQALALIEGLGEASGQEGLNQQLPIIGTNLTEILGWIDTIQDTITTLSQDPSATLDLLELAIESAIAEGLNSLNPDPMFDLPDFPDPADPAFAPGGVFDLAAFQAAVASYVSDLETALGAATSYVTLGYEPGTSPGALTFQLDIGVCSSIASHPGCTFEYPLTKDFNFDTASLGGAGGPDLAGIAGLEGEGTVTLDYGVVAKVHLGVELPTVSPAGPGEDAPQVDPSDGFRVFIADTSGITADIAGELVNAEFGASVGPFGVQVGETDALPESLIDGACDAGNTDDEDDDNFVNDGCATVANPETGTACDAGDTADDDGDGLVNDGCAAIAAAESGAACALGNTDDEDSDGLINDGCDAVDGGNDAETVCTGLDDEDFDGLANDGCEAVGNPMIARAGAQFSLTNDPNPGVDRFYLTGPGLSFGDFFSGIAPSITPIDGLDCDESAVTTLVACAHLPIYGELDLGGGDQQVFLGNIDMSLADFDFDSATITGADEVLQGLQDAGEAFLFDLLAQGIGALGDAIEQGTKAAAYDVSIPVVGDVLDAGAEVAEKFNTNVVDNVETLVGSLNSAGDFATIKSTISDFWWDTLDGARTDGAKPDLLLHMADPAVDPVQTEDVVVALLCTAALDPCNDTDHTLLDMRDVSFQIAIGQYAEATTPEFDWGVPGLSLRSHGGEAGPLLQASVDWRVNLGAGVGLDDGFYLLSNSTGEANDIEVNAAVDFGAGTKGADPLTDTNPALEGDLAFLSAAVWNAKDTTPTDGTQYDQPHEVSLTVGIDLFGDSTADTKVRLPQLLELINPTLWTVNLDGYIDFYATVATTAGVGGGASEGAIPRLIADIKLGWVLDTTAQDLFDGTASFGAFDAQFENIRLDLGSFISDFLGPVLEEVQKFTKPLEPIIDTLQAPIPGVSQLAELVGAEPITLLDLMEAISGADLTLIRRLLQVVSFANALPTSANLVIPIGAFTLDQGALFSSELPATSKNQLIGSMTPEAAAMNGGILDSLGTAGGSGFAEQVELSQGEGGFSFPAFEDPTKLFNLIVGQDVELIEFDAGKLKAEVGWSQSFGPITIGPIPVSVVVSIGAAVEGRFVIGYDTKGIRQLVQNLTDDSNENDGFFENLGALFAGVYIGDLADDGSDPPEIRLTLEGSVGAAIDLVVIKVGIEAGLRATLDLNLHDGGFLNPIPPENLDGKLRIDEIITFINNPLCLFDVSGKLEAFIRIFVTLDLFLFSVTYKQTIVNITLLELENITAELCQPPDPEPAEKSGSKLVLNVGDRANLRNFDVPDPPGSDQDEKIVVRQVTPGATGDVEVSYKGYTERYQGIDLIVGDGDGGNDAFIFEDGDISGTCRADGIVDPAVPGFWSMAAPTTGVSCLADVDGNGQPDHQVDDTVTFLVNFEIALSICGGPGKDKIGGGDGADLLVGDGELNNSTLVCEENGVAGGADDDTDTISGEGGDDTIYGNDGPDILAGGSGSDHIYGGNFEDEIVGGIGPDFLYGQNGNDGISGGPEFDPCPDDDHDDCTAGGDAVDYMEGGDGDDSMEGDHGDDEMHGGGDNDTMVGGLGDDEMHGDTGIDNLFGNEGDDVINGGDGDDDAYGGTGDDDMSGGAHDDDLVGEEGDDEIDGDGGRDVILGDLGVINRDPSTDPNVSNFDPSAGKLLVELVKSAGVPPAGHDDINGGPEPDRIWGQEGDDQIDGDGGDDVIQGNSGNDGIRGNAGGDEIFGNDGNDTIYGDAAPGDVNGASDGVDTIRGGNDADTISGNAQGDRLFGDAGNDTIFGDADAEVCADDGNDFIVAGSGNDLVFGNSGDDDIFGEGGVDRLVGGSNSAGVCDGDDDISGGQDPDVIAGDNAMIGDAVDHDDMLVTLLLDLQGDGDHDLDGDNGDDRIFGQVGDDVINGGNGNDYVEGNEGADVITGNAGDDDLIGGSSAGNGINGAIRNGSGRTDGSDTIDGDDAGQTGVDYIAGDNALIARNVPVVGRAPVELFDVETIGGAAVGADTSEGDVLAGGNGDDLMFGQGGADVIDGDEGADYIEGNHDDDTIRGGSGNDDLVGGGSANDGVIDADREGDTLADAGESLISGGPDEDWITGDNALIDRNVDSDAAAPIVLFDVETTVSGALPGTGGGELLITGDEGPDWIFGQTGNDIIEGNNGNDYVEGNNGDDTITGGGDDDDLVGGGSANDGVIDAARIGDTLLDVGETLVSGGPGVDWITGDNALVNRNRPVSGRAPIELFDVETTTSGEIPGTGGGEMLIDGGSEPDRIFGQTGNDLITGDSGADYIEGNNGVDTLSGGPDDDDIIGGGSANDGVIDGLRVGNGLLDQGENVVTGDAGNDWIAGDNALLNRNIPIDNGPSGPDRAPIELFDVQTSTGATIAPDVSGGDLLQGNDGEDRIFGQGNGAQPADQTDPVDGRNNDFNGTDEADGDFDRLAGTPDEDGSHQAGWLGDTILGGDDFDEIEGNHGNDLIYGNGDQDDIAGGGSADDGKIWDGMRLLNGAHLLDGADTIHGDDADPTLGDHDAIVGDNGWVGRTGATISGDGPEGVPISLAERLVSMTDANPDVGTYGNDYVAGNGGHDEIYGQAGDDMLEGEWGSDAMVGDLGFVVTELLGDGDANVLCGEARFLEPQQPFVGEDICVDGTLFRQVLLFAQDDTQTTAVIGEDVMLGGDGDDWMHGGAGADLIQGDGDGGAEIPDPDATYTFDVVDPNPLSADKDRIFGGDSNGRGTVDPVIGGDGDLLWGGRGDDYTWGGNGDDMIDVRPDGVYPATWSAWAEADVESYHGIDVSYGGWDQDAVQANVAANGPIAGDRILDWAGVYNISYLCPATYGAYVTIRGQAPSLIQWLLELAESSGAVTPGTVGSSGGNEVAMVYKKDVKNNTNPIYPGTPGHFTCNP